MSFEAFIKRHDSKARRLELCYVKAAESCSICWLIQELYLSSLLLLLLLLLCFVKISRLPLGWHHLQSFFVFNYELNHVFLLHVLFQEGRVSESLLTR